MKEITRIHIAKTPYDIELAAKKELETYLHSLETYSSDQEIIEDIEIRITEILDERGVKKDGVVTTADVTALKKQLGEPHDFMDENDAVSEAEIATGRKLYRDVDHRVLGGVLSGIAAFFKVNPVWVRLLFIIVALMSFGMALLIYAVLWIAVPPARTAAEKLQMSGRPVTVQSIRQFNESDAGRSTGSNQTAQRVMTILLGVGFVIGAIFAAGATVVAAFALALNRRPLFDVVLHSSVLTAAYVLAILSGLLLVVMFALSAYASFVQKISRRVLISLCVVVVLGLASFGIAIGLAQYGGFQIKQAIQANTRTQTLTMPVNSQSLTALDVDAKNVNVRYIVSKDAPSATLQMVTESTAALPRVDLSLQEGVLKVKMTPTNKAACNITWGCNQEPTITVYGPALTKLTAEKGASVDYHADDQAALDLTGGDASQVTFTGGVVGTLNLTMGNGANVDASEATVQHVEAEVKPAAIIEVGVVQTLAVTDKGACPARLSEGVIVHARQVMVGAATVNGKPYEAETPDSSCVRVTIEDKEIQ